MKVTVNEVVNILNLWFQLLVFITLLLVILLFFIPECLNVYRHIDEYQVASRHQRHVSQSSGVWMIQGSGEFGIQ